jgi:hypothetical protein
MHVCSVYFCEVRREREERGDKTERERRRQFLKKVTFPLSYLSPSISLSSLYKSLFWPLCKGDTYRIDKCSMGHAVHFPNGRKKKRRRERKKIMTNAFV